MIMPYLNFTGDCEEALRFYVSVFGGEIQHMVRYGDMPENPDAPMDEAQKHKIMHAQVMLTEAGGLSGADAVWPVEAGSAIHIHANLAGEQRARDAFAALAEGGTVAAPLATNPPPDDNGISGMVKDRFGFNWVVSAMLD